MATIEEAKEHVNRKRESIERQEFLLSTAESLLNYLTQQTDVEPIDVHAKTSGVSYTRVEITGFSPNLDGLESLPGGDEHWQTREYERVDEGWSIVIEGRVD